MQLHRDEAQARTLRAAVIASLHQVRGRAEIIDGTIVLMNSVDVSHLRATRTILLSLHEYTVRTRTGEAFGDSAAYVVDLPHRWSFCPDASFHVGGETSDNLLDGAPVFAAEIRSKGDYGKPAERRLAAKRAEYFAAGTLVVWDVDPLKDETVRVFRASAPNEPPKEPTVYRRGEIAEAEPAVPGWTLLVDDLFPRRRDAVTAPLWRS